MRTQVETNTHLSSAALAVLYFFGTFDIGHSGRDADRRFVCLFDARVRGIGIIFQHTLQQCVLCVVIKILPHTSTFPILVVERDYLLGATGKLYASLFPVNFAHAVNDAANFNGIE